MIWKMFLGSTIIWKMFLGSTIIASALTFYFWAALQQSLVQVTALRANVAVLESAKRKQDSTIERLQQLAEHDAATILQHGVVNHALEMEVQQRIGDLAILRNTEQQAALASRYERGNARYDRIYRSLMRLDAYSTAPDIGSKDDPGDVEASNTPTSALRGYEETIANWARSIR